MLGLASKFYRSSSVFVILYILFMIACCIRRSVFYSGTYVLPFSWTVLYFLN